VKDLRSMQRFLDKVVVVTGGAKGIGRGCCLRFAAEGAHVAVLDIVQADAAATADDCSRMCDRPALALNCDVTNPESVARAFDAVVETWSAVDILVAAAGIYSGQPLPDVPFAAWQKLIDVNLTGVFLADQAAVRVMLQTGRGMSVVNISSAAGKTSYPASAQYSASKSGIIGLTRSVAMDLAPHRINANSVCPGNTMTEMAWDVARAASKEVGMTPEAWIAMRSRDCPMGRYAKVEEVAALVAFLASDEGRFITGQAISIDGGTVLT
jgi:NAD(P)-dependent dehydrogenase (short-subunit alcohol dehydrogenase family)